MAVSAVIATIGSASEESISRFLMSGETNKSQIWTALSEDSADLSFNFIFKLLTEDAEKDDCEVPEVVMISEEPILGEALELLGAARENIRLENSHLTPRFTRIGLAAWIPVSKRKATALLAKKAG